jgi:predicted heme/steroid binding protein
MQWFALSPSPPPPPPPPIWAALDFFSMPFLNQAAVTVLALLAARFLHTARGRRKERRRLELAATLLRQQREELASRGKYDLDDLRRWDGRDGGPILLAMMGQVSDVTDGREFYGIHGCYHALQGCDASRALAKGLLEPESEEEASKPLTTAELNTLCEWREHYEFKYMRLGPLTQGNWSALWGKNPSSTPSNTKDESAGEEQARVAGLEDTADQSEWRTVANE